EALRLARLAGATSILNPAPADGLARWTIALADIVTPNEGELGVLAGAAGGPAARAKRLLGPDPGRRAVLVSLGVKGAILVTGGGRRSIAAPKVEAVDAVGAGDALNGALAAGLASGLELAEAARRAVVAASLAVTRAGARQGMPTAAELDAALSRGTRRTS
ncbi:MAG: ribokinase, partial [Chloroflexota bacterium]|nr:ribokinase [Chloroflexota bacterium]